MKAKAESVVHLAWLQGRLIWKASGKSKMKGCSQWIYETWKEGLEDLGFRDTDNNIA